MTPKMPSFVANTLALAIVEASSVPVLLLDDRLTVLAASASFCTAFHMRSDVIVDRLIANLGSGEWNIPQLAALLKAAASGHANAQGCEMNYVHKGRAVRRLLMTAKKLVYASDHEVRLILTISDVTDARAAEKRNRSLIPDKDVLIKEVHHRVANSLQVIASVLMQSARKVQSEETRQHLTDAHQRVMSVAALQRQLATTSLTDVEMKTYLTNLCQAIGASMISDHDHFSLEVEADNGTLTPEASVSIGLIVTELVINSLKHAFKDQLAGAILVDYHSTDENWILAVSDNGIGMPVGFEAMPGGLGTSIVHALATQLGANIVVTDARPGTQVTISHVENLPQQPAVAIEAAQPSDDLGLKSPCTCARF